MQTSTSVAPAPSLGIREFSRQSGYSEAKVRRAMRELSIKGQYQGRGKATLLNAEEQERLALRIDEIELHSSNSSPKPLTKPSAGKTAKSKSKSSPPLTSPKPTSSTSQAKPVSASPTQTAAPSSASMATSNSDTVTQSPSPPQETALLDQNSASDNAEVLDQLWDAHQLMQQQQSAEQHSPQNINPSHDSDVDAVPSSPIPQDMPQTNPPAPEHHNNALPKLPGPSENLSAAATSQPAPTYYDPYFDAHPAIAPATAIQPGNHRQTLATPTMPESYDLGQFRSEDTINTLADPGAIAAQAMGAIEALVTGMDADIQQQRIHLEETQRAAQALRLKAKQLQDKKVEYMIQSSTLGHAQQQSTLELQEALEGIQALGKSQSGEQKSP